MTVPVEPARRQRAASLRVHLVLLVLGALLPLILGGGWFIVRDAGMHRQEIREDLAGTARALGLALDRQLEVSFATLRTLAHLSTLSEADLAPFRAAAEAVLVERPEWSAVLLIAPSGQELARVAAAPGAPRLDSAELVERVLRTGAPAVSNLLTGDLFQRPQVLVAVPGFGTDGAVQYLVAASQPPERLGELLRRQRIPERWNAGIIDGNGMIVARANGAGSVVGRPAPAWLVEELRQPAPRTLVGPSLEGNPLEAAFSRSELAPWTLVYGAPADVVDAPLWQGLTYGVVGSGVAFLLSLGLALLIGHRITRPMLALVDAGDAMDRLAAVPEGPASPVSEVNAVRAAMQRAARRLLENSAERERHLRDSAQRAEQDLRLATSIGRLVAFKLDAALRFTWVSTPAMGLDPADVQGRTCEELFDATTAAMLTTLFRRVWEQGRAERAETTLRCGEPARECHVDLVVEPVRSEAGVVVGLTGVAYDVTGHVNAQREAERANDAKTRFLAAASHDLRQPIQAMRLLLYLLSEKAAGDSALSRVATRMGEALDSTERMLARLMEFAALESGKVSVAGQIFRLDDLVARIVAETTPEAERRGLRLRGATFACATVSDPVLLERIVRNLVSNAIRYTPSGGILVGMRRHGRMVRVVVYDTGCGVPEEMQSAIFEEFRQLANPERDRSKGMGLGLAIVARTAELLGHRLDVRSRENSGSAFSVEVPRLPSSAAEVQSTLDLTFPMAEHASLLVVEDDPMQAIALTSILEGAGFRVTTANGRRSAEQALQRMTPDLIVSDYRLPDGASGLDIIRGARQRFERFIPAILVTGDTQATIAEEAALEACAVFHKPYTPQTLVEAINRRLAETRRIRADATDLAEA